MSYFTDLKGRRWEVNLTFGDIIRLKNIGIDILGMDDDSFVMRGMDEIEVVPVTLGILLERQREKHGLKTDQDVYDAFDAETITRAEKSLTDAILHFFRTTGQLVRCSVMEKLIKARDQLKAVQAADVEAMLNPETKPKDSSNAVRKSPAKRVSRAQTS